MAFEFASELTVLKYIYGREQADCMINNHKFSLRGQWVRFFIMNSDHQAGQ